MKPNSDYFVNEGNKLGYMRSEFDTNGNVGADRFIADGDLIKGKVVEVTGYDAVKRGIKVKTTTAASANVIGVAMFDRKSGEDCSVETEGLFVLEAASVIAVPNKIASAADGCIAVAGADDPSIGIALTPATTVGDRIYVKFSI